MLTSADSWVSKARAAAPGRPPNDLCRVAAYSPDGSGDDVNEEFRAAVIARLCADVGAEDRNIALFLLHDEARAHESSDGYSDELGKCAYMLFLIGNVEDSLAIWRAKQTNFDTSCGVHVQLLVGAGLESTLTFLRASSEEDAQNAAAYIEECRAAGEFDDDYHAMLATHYA